MWTLASIMLTLASMLTLTLASMWTLTSVFKVIVVLFDSFVVSINFFRMAFITFACKKKTKKYELKKKIEQIKFSFSEKATKIWSYHLLDLTFTKYRVSHIEMYKVNWL